MSQSIFQNLPKVEQLLGLKPEELAGYLLEHFHSLSFGKRQQAMTHNLANDISSRYPSEKERVYRAISSACQRLINKNFLVPVGPQAVLELTDEGRQVMTAAAFRAYLIAKTNVSEPLQSSHADELYNKVRNLIGNTKPLDVETAKMIIELADDAIKEFGSTNQEKKVELRKWKKDASEIVPPETLKELKERAESKVLQTAYPKSSRLQRIVLWLIGGGVITFVLITSYKELVGEKEVTKGPEAPSNTMNVNATPTIATASPTPSNLPSSNSSSETADEKALKLKREGEALMNADRLSDAISKFNTALKIPGISSGVESELRQLLIRARTRLNISNQTK